MAKDRKSIKIQHRLLTRLLISHILIVALPLFLTGMVLVDTAQDSIEKTILDRNLKFARRSTRLINLKLEMAWDIIRNEAKSKSIYEMNKSAQELAINTIVSEFELFNNLSILDTLGKLIATTSFEEEISEKFSSNGMTSTILSSISNGQRFQSDVYVSDEHLPMLDIAEPIRWHNEVVGILYAVVDLKAMWDLVQENVEGKRGEAFIFNKQGVYIAHSDPKKVYSKKIFENQEIIDKIKDGEHGQTLYRTSQNVEMVAAYAPIGNFGWGFMIQQPTSEAFEPARRMRVRVFQSIIGSVLLASLLAYFYTKWIVKPVDHLVSGMERFSTGDLDYRIKKVGSDEVGTLAEHFNEMADRLIEFQNTLKRTERFETLGKLASVLSHEIRNPLNSMVINMQILKRELSKEVIDREKVERFYGIVTTEIKRVDQLVSDFLLIARPPKLERSKVALNEVLDEVVTTHVAEALNKGIRVERDYEQKPVYANVDLAKIRQVFLNLFINALQAMPGGGKLTIGMKECEDVLKSKKKERENSVEITFCDTGHGIRKEDLHKIFDFYYSTKKEGTGLGLAVVQQIVEEHQGDIAVDSNVGVGTTFTVYLPQDLKGK
ncbi:MAG: ATP-binding protein [bacterium]